MRLYSRFFAFVALVLALPCLAPVVRADDASALVGKPAPDLQPDFGINGKAVSLADLKGKVVMVDFWAVWCGPCVSTFPHLIEWNKAYKNKGLEIVGVTSYYQGFGFDKTTGKLIKAPEKLTKEKEQEMLKDFTAHHKLDYRILALPQDEWKKVGKAYNIEGIPTVALIDRKGVVQMVKVGAGEANAKALEEMIKKLLDEK